jgi:hypothetical protein
MLNFVHRNNKTRSWVEFYYQWITWQCNYVSDMGTVCMTGLPRYFLSTTFLQASLHETTKLPRLLSSFTSMHTHKQFLQLWCYLWHVSAKINGPFTLVDLQFVLLYTVPRSALSKQSFYLKHVCPSHPVCFCSQLNTTSSFVYLPSLHIVQLYEAIQYITSLYKSVAVLRRLYIDTVSVNGPGIQSRWGRDFQHPPRPTLGPTQPPVQWEPDHSRG